MNDRFTRAREALERAHCEDPRLHDGETWSLFYHRKLAEWLDRLAPDASEELRLAVRSQHIRRWRSPRSDYPEGKLGYKQWRQALARFHADEAGQILSEAGYDPDFVERVRCLIRKENLKTDPDCQTLEDVICLVFLENEFVSFAEKHEEGKLKTIVRKTLQKMSDRGREEALKLVESLPERERAIARKAAAELP